MDFWTTIAQISGSLIGLVFVVLALYQSEIREKLDALQEAHDLIDVSREPTITMSATNLGLLSLPLVYALAVLTWSRYSQATTAAILTVSIIVGVAISWSMAQRNRAKMSKHLRYWLEYSEQGWRSLIKIRCWLVINLWVVILISSIVPLYTLVRWNEDKTWEWILVIEALCFLSAGVSFTAFDIVGIWTDRLFVDLTPKTHQEFRIMNYKLRAEVRRFEVINSRVLNLLQQLRDKMIKEYARLLSSEEETAKLYDERREVLINIQQFWLNEFEQLNLDSWEVRSFASYYELQNVFERLALFRVQLSRGLDYLEKLDAWMLRYQEGTAEGFPPTGQSERAQALDEARLP